MLLNTIISRHTMSCHSHFSYPQFINTCFLPLFPFFFPPVAAASVSPSFATSGVPLPLPLPLPFTPHEKFDGVLVPRSRRTSLPPYPAIELMGLAAGGNAGKASPVAPPLVALDAGLDVGGVGLVDTGFEMEGELVALAHGVAVPRPALARLDAPVGVGRPGKATLEAWLPFAAEALEGPAESNERRDFAVDDFSFSILELF